MFYRPHRGSLEAAMTECIEIDGTMAALRAHLAGSSESFELDTVEVKTYAGPDDRIGWPATFIVMAVWVDGVRAPVGFTDQMPAESK